jgi:soluble lytic murein transglycosylase-like protein
VKDWRIKVDCAFVVSLAVTATIALCSCKPAEVAEITFEPTTLDTTAETTEEVTEPTETEPTVTEATEPTETLPPITLYDVPLSVELQLHMIETAKVNGIDPAILFAIACRESNYRSDAIGDSGSSLGLMQVQPYWHSERMERLGCTDLLDPFQNVTVAVDYLVELLTRYGTIDKALVAYNKGHYAGTITEYAVAVMNIAEEVRGTKYVHDIR